MNFQSSLAVKTPEAAITSLQTTPLYGLCGKPGHWKRWKLYARTLETMMILETIWELYGMKLWTKIVDSLTSIQRKSSYVFLHYVDPLLGDTLLANIHTFQNCLTFTVGNRNNFHSNSQIIQVGGYETIRVDTFYVLRRMQRFSMLNLIFIYSF